MKITLEDIFNITSAVVYNPDLYKSATSVSIDTRTIKKNSIFVAIKGKNFDGHNFIKDAIKKGATSIVVSNRKLSKLDFVEIPIISVKNTLNAYGELANVWRNKFAGKVISITGSNGKTSTKEMIAHLLSSKYKVHKTILNNNNNIGVPLTLLSAPQNVDFIVLEHGTNHFGEIEYTAKIAQPDYAIITNIGTSHLEFLKSKEKVLEEKISLFNHVKKDGCIFINNDDALLKTKKRNFNKIITFGSKGSVDVKERSLGYDDEAKPKLKILGFNKNLEFTLPLLGRSNSENILAAVSVTLKIGLTKKEILRQIKKLQPVKGRLVLSDFKNFSLIDDTYNANPESMKKAIEVLAKFRKRKNKIFVLGDMFELGKDAKKYHEQIGKEITKLKQSELLTIGKNAKYLNEASTSLKVKKHHFNYRSKLNNYLESLNINNSVILVKGSRGMEMEEFLETIKRKAA